MLRLIGPLIGYLIFAGRTPSVFFLYSIISKIAHFLAPSNFLESCERSEPPFPPFQPKKRRWQHHQIILLVDSAAISPCLPTILIFINSMEIFPFIRHTVVRLLICTVLPPGGGGGTAPIPNPSLPSATLSRDMMSRAQTQKMWTTLTSTYSATI